ncbi:MAG: DUF3892 domain-containing protein [Actinomycetota bacterium]|nr:DUF3892 domain-containing protein [Actinomycetota bacterium]
MSTFSITEVHLERAPGATHDHIARVKLLGHTQDYSRQQIINSILGGDMFFTYARPPAQVFIHECPHCRASDYITTHPDNTPRNNLLHLPKY